MKMTHCRRGHEMTPENISRHGRCQACKRGDTATPLPPRTHCLRGHELTDETSWIDSRGYRACRICRRMTNLRYKTRQTTISLDAARVVKWLEGWFSDHPHITPADLAAKCDVSQRVFYDLRGGRRKTIQFDTVDKLLCGTGQPQLLRCFYNPKPDGSEGPLTALPKPESRKRRTVPSARCRSGDGCSRASGHGPNGWFCVHHGPELDRIAAELTKKQSYRRRNYTIFGTNSPSRKVAA